MARTVDQGQSMKDLKAEFLFYPAGVGSQGLLSWEYFNVRSHLRGNYRNISEQDGCRLVRVTEEGLKESLVGKWVIKDQSQKLQRS